MSEAKDAAMKDNKAKGKGKGKGAAKVKPVRLTKEEMKKKQLNKLRMRVLRKKKKFKSLAARRPHLSVPVPEGMKKSWELTRRNALYRKEKRRAQRKGYFLKRRAQAERIRQYDVKYMAMEKEKKDKILEARKAGNFYKPCDAKVAIVIRIRGINAVSPKVRKVLELFRLLQIHNAVFIKLNKATINMLKLVQPYVAYGYPNVETIRKLVYKRGFAKIRHRPGAISRIPIMDNELIEKHLGKYGIETVEDIVDQIYTCGPYFREASNFLWPFKLTSPRGGYRGRKRRHFLEGGTYGNWERFINFFVKKML